MVNLEVGSCGRRFFRGWHYRRSSVSTSAWTRLSSKRFSLEDYTGMSNSVSMVVVQLACPDKRAIAGLNGVSTCVQCLSRVIGPWLVSSVSDTNSGRTQGKLY